MAFAWGDPAKSSDVASAFKPLLTTLLFMAIQEGKLGSVDDRVAVFEPRLQSLNGGKDAGITWRHLASQTSGLPEWYRRRAFWLKADAHEGAGR
jgi:CubicO group peptidase (beta-lactamase class C family)